LDPDFLVEDNLRAEEEEEEEKAKLSPDYYWVDSVFAQEEEEGEGEEEQVDAESQVVANVEQGETVQIQQFSFIFYNNEIFLYV
jgi:hypothetical protein